MSLSQPILCGGSRRPLVLASFTSHRQTLHHPTYSPTKKTPQNHLGTAPGVFKNENAAISSAKELVLTTKEESGQDGKTCGGISTPLVVSSDALSFGFYEIRAVLGEAGKGSLMSSFFLQSTYGGGEISIVDAVPNAKSGIKVSNNYHCFSPVDGSTTKSSPKPIANLDTTNGFHTYGIERGTDGAVKFYIDGTLARTVTPADASCLQQPMKVIFSMVTDNVEGVPSGFTAHTSHIQYFRHWTHLPSPASSPAPAAPAPPAGCTACADGTYMAATSHSNTACTAYSACPAGQVRNALSKTTQGGCQPCNAGTVKTAGVNGRWDDKCTADANAPVKSGNLDAGGDEYENSTAATTAIATDNKAADSQVTRIVFEGIIAACCLYLVYTFATRKPAVSNAAADDMADSEAVDEHDADPKEFPAVPQTFGSVMSTLSSMGVDDESTDPKLAVDRFVSNVSTV